ncbi:MAG: hypothetical protein Q8T08_16570, partial [Ignavibacteria bacterium]|nr:hypothetical protein [Ignavibacteria bacterium]
EFPAQIEASNNAQITFSTSAGEICIFRSNSKYGELKRITTTVSEYTLTNLKDVIDKNDRIIIAVSNGSVMPTDGTKDVTFKYKFEEAVDLSKNSICLNGCKICRKRNWRQYSRLGSVCTAKV